MRTTQVQPVFSRVVYLDLLRFALLALGVGAAFSVALSLVVLSTANWAEAAALTAPISRTAIDRAEPSHAAVSATSDDAQNATAPRKNPLGLDLDLNAGFALVKLSSSYQAIDVVQQSAHHYHFTLGGMPANKDFELVWAPQPGATPQAAVFTKHHAGKTYALMMVIPPLSAELGQHRLPRETVFIVDTPGSIQHHTHP